MSWKVNSELKTKILSTIKQDGMSVKQASLEYGVSTVSIYDWLRKWVEALPWEKVDLGKIRRLEKDKEDMLIIIWAMQLEINKLKKKKS